MRITISMRFLEQTMTARGHMFLGVVRHRSVVSQSSFCSMGVMRPQYPIHRAVASGLYRARITFPLKTLPMLVEPSRELPSRARRCRCPP
jgi:hypothetical protein